MVYESSKRDSILKYWHEKSFFIMSNTSEKKFVNKLFELKYQDVIFLEFFYILQKKKLFLAFFQHCIKCSLINHFWQFWIFMWWSVSNVSFLCSFVFQIPRCSTYLHKFKKCNFHKTYFTIKGISICRSQTLLKKFSKWAITILKWNEINNSQRKNPKPQVWP